MSGVLDNLDKIVEKNKADMESLVKKEVNTKPQ